MTTSTAPTTVMSLNSVSRDYRQGDETVHALRSTNLQLRAGELVGILGPSGSGKSTLLTVMGGLRTPSSGTVTISGEPFSALPEKRRARLRFRRIGFVLQASGLVPFLRLNDQFGLHNRVSRTKDNTDRRDHLLDSLGISKRAHAYPSELSGGALPSRWRSITNRTSSLRTSRPPLWTPDMLRMWPTCLLIRPTSWARPPSWSPTTNGFSPCATGFWSCTTAS